MKTSKKKKKAWSNPAENILNGYYEDWRGNHDSLNSKLLLPVEVNTKYFKADSQNWYSVEAHLPPSDYIPHLGSSYTPETVTDFRNVTYRVSVSKENLRELRSVFGLYRYVYNLCVEYCPSLNDFRTVKGYVNKVKLKTHLRRLITGKETSIVPALLTVKGSFGKLQQFQKTSCNLLDRAIYEYVDALSTQEKLRLEAAYRGYERNYEMKRRTKNSSYVESMTIDKKDLTRKGDKSTTSITIFPKGINITFNFKGAKPLIEHACKVKITKDSKVYFDVPMLKEGTTKTGNLVAALDPGVRIFQSTFDNRGYSYLFGGNGDAEKLDVMLQKADRLRKGFKDIRRGGKVIKVLRKAPLKECFKTNAYIIRHNKETSIRLDGIRDTQRVTKKSKLQNLRRAAARIELKVKNRIKYFHQKLAKDLCSVYSKILIPNFRVKSMSERTKNGNSRVIGRTTTRQMIRWGHYSFRELLKAKGAMTGTKVVECTEEYTSKTCTNCLYVKHDLGDAKVYSCSNCGLVLHRDINAARNILMMNWNL